MVSAVRVLAIRHLHHHLIGGPIILLVIAVIIFLIVSRSRQRLNGARRFGSTHDETQVDMPANTAAERMLSESFARGEISLDDYHKRLVALRETGVDPGNGVS